MVKWLEKRLVEEGRGKRADFGVGAQSNEGRRQRARGQKLILFTPHFREEAEGRGQKAEG
ncbi:MAG: hypothetical protein KME42_24070 [Tildeniella nuda ZEHNDER 1965/U140]|jgi:hypothetical protein|nr:hypothetical protein [Tildeniella nuda ZEHNDER 1965/U140]